MNLGEKNTTVFALDVAVFVCRRVRAAVRVPPCACRRACAAAHMRAAHMRAAVCVPPRARACRRACAAGRNGPILVEMVQFGQNGPKLVEMVQYWSKWSNIGRNGPNFANIGPIFGCMDEHPNIFANLKS